MRFPPAMISLSYGYFLFFSLSTENRGLLCKWRAHVSTAKWVKWFSSPKCCRIRSCICKKFHRAQLGIPSYICIARAVDQHNFFSARQKKRNQRFLFYCTCRRAAHLNCTSGHSYFTWIYHIWLQAIECRCPNNGVRYSKQRRMRDWATSDHFPARRNRK